MASPLRPLPDLPGVKYFAAFAIGIVVSGCCDTGITAGIGAGALVVAAALGFVRRSGGSTVLLRSAVLLIAVCAVGMLRGLMAGSEADTTLLRFADTRDRHEFRVVVSDDAVVKQHSMQMPCEVLAVNGNEMISGRVQVVLAGGDRDALSDVTVPQIGDTLRLRGSVRTPRPAVNPGGFDYRAWLLRRDVTCMVLVSTDKDWRVEGKVQGFRPVQTVVGMVRSYVRGVISSHFKPRQAGVMLGLIIGERGFIDDDINEDFRASGVFHILSVSGSHVAVVLAILWLVLGRLRRPVKTAVVVPVLILYAVLTGGDAPVVRSVIMAAVLLLGTQWQRITHPINALAVSGIIILFIEPRDLYDLGFQLSFGAVAFLLLYHGPIMNTVRNMLPARLRSTAVEKLCTMLVMTLVAQAGTTPIIMTVFGQFPLVSFIANLVIVPLVSLCIASAMPVFLFHPIGTYPAALYAATSNFALDVVLYLSDLFAKLPFAVITTGAWPVWVAVLAVVMWVWTFNKKERMRQRVVITLLACCALAICLPSMMPSHPEALRVTFLDVGQGDCVFVEWPEGNMMIDTGPSSRSGDAGRKIIVPYLRHEGITSIDALLITHPDDDHLGGAISVMDAIAVRHVYRSGAWPTNQQTATFDSIVREKNIPIDQLHSGYVLRFDNARMYVLAPDSAASTGAACNNTSTVLRLQYGNVSMLLTGDAEKKSEGRMIQQYGDMLITKLLKLGHHGSRTSTTEEFLKMVDPAEAVISCGRLNRFKHPHPSILRRVVCSGTRIHRTDIEGAIMFETDGTSLRKVDWRN